MAEGNRKKRDVKKEHYDLGILLTEKKKTEILKAHFKPRVGYDLNLDDPKSFNEKIMWLKLFYQDPLITRCCDKFAVKGYVVEKIGDGHTVPNLAQWDSPQEIDLDALPDRFALKVNWSSGYNIIVPDKTKLDMDSVRKRLNRWIQPDRSAYYQFFNWGYKYMKPVIYAEAYMEQAPGVIYDYKFFCCAGEPKWFLIAAEQPGRQTRDYYDMDFCRLDFRQGKYPHSELPLEKPRFFEEMVRCARILAEPFPFVRVDFYETAETFYVGEMTFYPGGGIVPFDSKEWDDRLGNMIPLPDKRITDRESGVIYHTKVTAARLRRRIRKWNEKRKMESSSAVTNK